MKAILRLEGSETSGYDCGSMAAVGMFMLSLPGR